MASEKKAEPKVEHRAEPKVEHRVEHHEPASEPASAEQQAAHLRAEAATKHRLDEAKRKGGHFIGADGEPHDAHGEPIKKA